ncbi:MAG: membrane dipeptidase, partial [Pyrinomonadaceae bacterium]
MHNRKLSRRAALASLAVMSLVAATFPQMKPKPQMASAKSAPVTDTLAAARSNLPTIGGAPVDPKLWQRAMKLQRSSIVVDTHNDILSFMYDDDYDISTSSVGLHQTDIPRMKQGGLTAEFFSVFVDRVYADKGGAARRALDLIDRVYRAVEQHPNDLMIATSAEDIRRAKREGQVAGFVSTQNTVDVGLNLERLNQYYDMGMRMIQLMEQKFMYEKGVTNAASPITDMLRLGRGVCQDFTHLMIGMARAMNIPARYVSGYLHPEAQRYRGYTQTHAWCELYFPQSGWVGFDAANKCTIAENFVKVAVGRDFRDVPPNKGIFRGNAKEQINVEVHTDLLDEIPAELAADRMQSINIPTFPGAHTAHRELATQQQ